VVNDDDAVLEALDELYRTAPDAFVARRTELAKELTAAGDKAGAKEVKAAKRPTVAAWALNQVRDSAPELVDEACELADIGRAVLSGERAGDTRALAAQRRSLVMALLQEARAVLTAAELDVSAATERQVVETLDAALVSPDVAELLAVGRLLAATTATGFEGLISVDNPFALTEPSDDDAPRPQLKVLKGGKQDVRSSGAEGDDDDDAEVEAAAAALLEQRRAETLAAAEKANAHLEEVQEELDEASAALDELQQQVQDAEQALVSAQAAAKDAEHRLAEVQERLETAEADAEAAEAAAKKAATRA
jgi:hypothetical protein